MNKKPNVICIHIGARAHYLIPAALQQKGVLHTLITDTWVANTWLRTLFQKTPLTAIKSLAGRYTPNVPTQKVHAFGFKFLALELYLRLRYPYSWASTIARDTYFQQQALQALQKHINHHTSTLFAISYTALACLQEAEKRGLKTILFQVDPGIEEEYIVQQLLQETTTTWQPAPAAYWANWRKECALASVIMVNSDWSKKALVKQGVEETKIKIIPLPFELQDKHSHFNKQYPNTFTKERPLHCLFLGTLALRKGIHLVLEAAKALVDYPIHFILVGRNELTEAALHASNVTYKGIVSRAETDASYQAADVFLFPTFSDGFGLTQLEAMAWQLPVIASLNCGTVVKDNQNGRLLHENKADELVRLLTHILAQPQLLQSYSQNCLPTVRAFNKQQFTSDLDKVV